MSDSSADRDPLDRLAEEFVERLRAGERPSVSEYAARLPDRADEVRDLFPALVEMEQLKPVTADHTGDFEPKPEAVHPGQVGEFRILRQVGRGGMGVVYEAVQESLGRHVALKLLPADALADPARLERFRREAKAAARLHHTNIVPVFGTGVADGRHFYAMQFIAGHPLDAVIDEVRRLKTKSGAAEARPATEVAASMRTGTYPPRQSQPAATGAENGIDPSSSLSGGPANSRQYWAAVARIGTQVADALAYAHAQGVLHRDIKPANLLLDTGGTVWVTDFGLAKAAESDDLTQAGDIVGTLRYMAPERFDGQGDHRADVYALGLTLYELLALKPAFSAANRAKLIERVVAADAPPPRAVNAAIPRDLETVVLKATARDPARRYQSAGELADDLRRFGEDRPIRARRVSAREHVWRWCRRNKAVAALSGATLGLLILLAVGSLGFALWRGRQLEKTELARQDAAAARNEALERLRESYFLQARSDRWSQQFGRRFDGLAALAKAAAIATSDAPTQLDLRNEAITSLALTDISRQPDWSVDLTTHRGFTVHPGFEHYATWSAAEGAVSVHRCADRAEIARFPALKDSIWPVVFSPDGRTIAFGSRGALPDDPAAPKRHRFDVWDWREQKPVLTATDAQAGSIALHFSPDNARLVVSWWRGKVTAYDLHGKRPPTPIPTRAGSATVFAAFHPEGSTAAFVDGKTVTFCNPATGREVSKPLVAPNDIYCVNWSPDGKQFALGCVNMRGYVHDADTGVLRATLVGHQAEVNRVFFSPDGSLVVSTDYDGVTRLWTAHGGRHLVTARGAALGFSRDGTRLSFLDGARGGIWRVAAGREYRELWGHTCFKGPGGVRWVLGGRLVASSGDDATRLWDPATGKQIGLLPASGPSLHPHPEGASWFTGGASGFHRWPVELSDAGGRLRVGPPQKLYDSAAGSHKNIELSADGQWLVINDHQRGRAVVQSTTDSSHRQTLAGLTEPAGVRISPDNRWIVVGGWPAAWFAIYDRATEQCVLKNATHTTFTFSPDGRWLATGTSDGGRIVEVGSWNERCAIPPRNGNRGVGTLSYSPDGKTLAVVRSDHVIQLLDAATMTEFAALESPTLTSSPRSFDFSADGSQLAVAYGTRVVHLWNLREIRRGLAGLGLDWDAPPFPEAGPSPGPPAIEVIGGERLQTTSVRRALELNNQAWPLLVGAADKRDPAKALKLIQEAVKLQPTDATLSNTLGVALYRTGSYRNAVATFEKSVAASQGQWDGFDLYFLAMCHAKLGDDAKAKECLDRAVLWVERQENLTAEHADELKSFRDEAEGLISNTPTAKAPGGCILIDGR